MPRKKISITLDDLATSIKEDFDDIRGRLDRIEQRQDEHGRGIERSNEHLADLSSNQRMLVRTLNMKRILSNEEARSLGHDVRRV